MIDYILEVSFDAREAGTDDVIQSLLFVSATTGSTTREANGTITIAAYFDGPAERAEAASLLAAVDGAELHAVERERVDWLEMYQQSLEPLFIGRRFVVVPDRALIPPGSDRMTIIVPQEQAFGTGSHETTSLCIELLESIALAGTRGLDVGAGSGILALAMHRLGAAKAIAFDNDTDAYGALRDNRLRNEVSPEAMPIFIGSVEALRGGQFGVITMNIIPEVILPLLPEVTTHLAPGARLILSGILLVKRDEVVAAATARGLTLLDERGKGEWWAGLFECV